MGSSFFGDPNFLGGANDHRSSTTSNSSRKGKKSNSSDKPKQPQRGLGVAQLEKIRLHSQLGGGGGCTGSYLPAPPSLHHHHHHSNPYSSANISQEDVRLQTPYSSSYSSSASYGFPVHQQSFMMGLSEKGNISRYPDSQPSTTSSRWHHGNAVLESQHFAHQQPSITRHFLNQEDLLDKRRKDWSSSMGSSSQHSNSSGNNQELDLELRLSL